MLPTVYICFSLFVFVSSTPQFDSYVSLLAFFCQFMNVLFFSLHSLVASLVKGYTITIDLDDMLIFLTPLKSQGTIISQLRRLSTVGDSVDPCGTMPTSRSWYWEENVKVWRTYDKDCSVRYKGGKGTFSNPFQ